MIYGLNKPLSRPNARTMSETKEVAKCLHCHREFIRETIKFSIVSCSYCRGPNYNGKLDTNDKRNQFNRVVLQYQFEEGMNPPPGLENSYYHQVYHSAPVQPRQSQVPSTQKRKDVEGSSSSIYGSQAQTRNNAVDLQENTTQNWAEWIGKLVCQKVSEATEGLQGQIKALQETINAQQEKIDQLERQIQTSQISKKNQGEASGIASESLQISEVLSHKLNELGDQYDSHNDNSDEVFGEDGGACPDSEEAVEEDTDLPIPPKDFFVPEWVTYYNPLPLSGGKDDAVNFANYYSAKEVAQTEESLSQYWVGQKDGIYFETNSNTGSYWLISSQDQQQDFVYHIVPNKRKFRFTESALSAMQAYFNFSIEGIDSSQLFKAEEVNMTEFHVIRPAEVMEVETNQLWRLQNKGLLEFKPMKEEDSI